MKTETVILSNRLDSHPKCSPVAEARYHEDSSIRLHQENFEFIRDLDYQGDFGTGKFEIFNYNYRTPDTKLSEKGKEEKRSCYTGFEQYDHREHHMDHCEGELQVAIRKEQEASTRQFIEGSGSCRSFNVGHVFKLTGHFLKEVDEPGWTLIGMKVTAIQGKYRCTFKALPATTLFRPPRTTPKSRVQGIQTAIVTGPAGSKVYLDELGRCKLQFHWDREGPSNDRSSMWVRVQQQYAGPSYGFQWIPRVGHEVIVDFVNGDPDRPIVTGRVYNETNRPPLGPAQKWQNIIKTIKDNHIMMDDQDGCELVDVRAQKNMNTLVLNDKTITVYHNKTTSVGNDEATMVGHDKSIQVGNDFSTMVGNDMSTRVCHDQVLQVDNDKATVVCNDFTTRVDHDKVTEVKNDMGTVVRNNKELAVENNYTQVVTNDKNVEVSCGNYTEQICSGNYSRTTNKDETILVENGDRTTTVATGSMTQTIKAGKNRFGNRW